MVSVAERSVQNPFMHGGFDDSRGGSDVLGQMLTPDNCSYALDASRGNTS